MGIIIGQILGSGDLERAKDTDRKLIFFSTAAGFVTGGIMVSLSGIFPLFYNTTDQVRTLASQLIIISGAFMPVQSFLNAAYFTIRSGGRTLVTFLFDSVYIWCITVPAALLLVTFTKLDIRTVYFLCQCADIIKVTIGFILVKKGVWIRSIVPAENSAPSEI